RDLAALSFASLAVSRVLQGATPTSITHDGRSYIGAHLLVHQRHHLEQLSIPPRACPPRPAQLAAARFHPRATASPAAVAPGGRRSPRSRQPAPPPVSRPGRAGRAGARVRLPWLGCGP